MSGINTPFQVDEHVLGIVGPIFNPSVTPPDVFAQGLLTQSLNLDPSVPSQVVKLQSSDAELSAFALHGNISHRSGVMSSPNHPATALSVTFSSDGRVSNAVFGTIKPVTADHQQIHATHGFHASFGTIPAKQAQKVVVEKERWGCTKVVIGDTRWSPWISCTKVTDVEADAIRNEQPFFCHDFVSDEIFLQLTKHTIPIGHGFEHLYDEGYGCKLILRPDGEITQRRVSGSGNPSVDAVERGKQILLKCNALLQSKMTTIQWLEQQRLARPQVNDVFGWMNGFIASHPRQSLFFGARQMTPSMQTSIWSQLLINPMAHVKSNKAVNPCKCTPMQHDPACINEFCKFKLAHAHPSILSQDVAKQAVSQRLDATRNEMERAKAAKAAKAVQDAKEVEARHAAAAARKLEIAAKNLEDQKRATAIRQSEMAERAVARAAASAAKSNTVPVKPVPVKPAAAKGKPGASAGPGASASVKPGASASARPGASASASAAAKTQVESTIKKPASKSTQKKGGSKTRKLKLKSRRRLRK
jgi:hypothetical protein